MTRPTPWMLVVPAVLPDTGPRTLVTSGRITTRYDVAEDDAPFVFGDDPVAARRAAKRETNSAWAEANRDRALARHRAWYARRKAAARAQKEAA